MGPLLAPVLPVSWLAHPDQAQLPAHILTLMGACLLRPASLSLWPNRPSPRHPLTWRGGRPCWPPPPLRPARGAWAAPALPACSRSQHSQPPRPGFTRWCLTLAPLPLSIFTSTPASQESGSFQPAPGLEHNPWGTQAPGTARLHLGEGPRSRGAKQVEACLSGQHPCAQAAGLRISLLDRKSGRRPPGGPWSTAVPWASPRPRPVLRRRGLALPAAACSGPRAEGPLCAAPCSPCAKLPGGGGLGFWLKSGFF